MFKFCTKLIKIKVVFVLSSNGFALSSVVILGSNEIFIFLVLDNYKLNSFDNYLS